MALVQPSGWSAESSKSLGMKLISRLGRQLGGKLNGRTSTRDTVCVGLHSLRDRGVAYRRHHLPAEVGNDHSDSAAQW